MAEENEQVCYGAVGTIYTQKQLENIDHPERQNTDSIWKRIAFWVI